MDIIFLFAGKVGYTSQDYISNDTERDSVSDVVSERHNRKGQEGRNSVNHILKINFADRLGHKHTDNDQCCSSGRAWDQCNNRSQEQCKQEADTSRYSSQTCTSAFSDTGSTFYISSSSGSTEHCTACYSNRIYEHCVTDTSLAFFFVLHNACTFSSTYQCAESIKQLYKSKGSDCGYDTGVHDAVPVKFHEVQLGEIRNPRGLRAAQRTEINGTHQNSYKRCTKNTEQDCAAYLQHHQNSDQQKADNNELDIGVFQAAHMNDCLEGQNVCKFISRNVAAGFNADCHQSAVLEADNRNEHPDTNCNGMLEAVRNCSKQYLPDSGNRKENEDQTGNEYGGQTHLPGERVISSL
ncbi:hypothetical protein D3C80_1148810 [compost metagenome]